MKVLTTSWRKLNPDRAKEIAKGTRLRHPEIEQRATAKWRANNPDKVHAYRRMAAARRYKITIQEYEALFAAQHGRCAICHEAKPVLSIDHCHKRGAVRGLLCRSCNLMIGNAGESTDALKSAINYLEHWHEQLSMTAMVCGTAPKSR